MVAGENPARGELSLGKGVPVLVIVRTSLMKHIDCRWRRSHLMSGTLRGSSFPTRAPIFWFDVQELIPTRGG